MIGKPNILAGEAKAPSWELGYVLGMLYGDGTLEKEGRIKVDTVNGEWAKKITYLLSQWSGFNATVHSHKRNFCHKPHPRFQKYDFSVEVYRVRVYSKDAMRFLEPYVREEIPTSILENPLLSRGFLSGFFDSEGTVKTTTGCSWVGLYTSNKIHALQIQKLLAMLGIKPYFYARKKQRIFEIVVYGLENLKQFFSVVNSLHPEKATKLQKLVGDDVKKQVEGPMPVSQ